MKRNNQSNNDDGKNSAKIMHQDMFGLDLNIGDPVLFNYGTRSLMAGRISKLAKIMVRVSYSTKTSERSKTFYPADVARISEELMVLYLLRKQ